MDNTLYEKGMETFELGLLLMAKGVKMMKKANANETPRRKPQNHSKQAKGSK